MLNIKTQRCTSSVADSSVPSQTHFGSWPQSGLLIRVRVRRSKSLDGRVRFAPRVSNQQHLLSISWAFLSSDHPLFFLLDAKNKSWFQTKLRKILKVQIAKKKMFWFFFVLVLAEISEMGIFIVFLRKWNLGTIF